MKIKDWLGILTSIALLAWLLHSYDFEDVWRSLSVADFCYFIPLPALVILNFSLRALRWRGLFFRTRPRSLANVFNAMMTGYLLNNILPARAGELVKIVMLARMEALSKSAILATVTIEKILDLFVIMLLLVYVLMFHPFPAWLEHAGNVVGIVTLLALGAMVLLKLYGESFVALAIRAAGFLPQSSVVRLNAAGTAFVNGISELFKGANAARFFAFTFVIWVLELLITSLVAQSFQLNPSFDGLLFVILVIALGTVVPASPGYIGTYEFFGVSALALLGIKGGAALGFIIALHFVNFAGSSAIGLCCLTLQNAWGLVGNRKALGNDGSLIDDVGSDQKHTDKAR